MKIIVMLLCLIVVVPLSARDKGMRMRKFYVVGQALKTQPIMVEATSRLDALTRIGLTVATEADWRDAQSGMPPVRKGPKVEFHAYAPDNAEIQTQYTVQGVPCGEATDFILEVKYETKYEGIDQALTLIEKEIAPCIEYSTVMVGPFRFRGKLQKIVSVTIIPIKRLRFEDD